MGCSTCSPRPGAPACSGSLSKHLTVIITTSPVRSNPSLELIDCTVDSLKYAPGIASCKKLLVCDHYKVCENSSKSFRSGVITASHVPKYNEYKRLLAGRMTSAEPGSPYSNMTLLELQSHHGFGFAVQQALEHVSTPLVMVIQHDRDLHRLVDIAALVNVLNRCPDINMISLLTKTTMHHSTRVQSRCTQAQERCHLTIQEWKELSQPRFVDGVRLVRMLQWLDSTHVAKVDFYRGFVFRGGLVKRGAFIEDRLGNAMLDALRSDGAAAPRRYGCWIHDDGAGQPMVVHNHGRAFLTRDEKRGRRQRGATERRTPCRSSGGGLSDDGIVGVGSLFDSMGLTDCPPGSGPTPPQLTVPLCSEPELAEVTASATVS